MAENQDITPGKKTDKKIKPAFNSNWIWFILLASVLLVEVIFSTKTTPPAKKSELIAMIEKHHVKSIVVINYKVAEIFLTEDAIKSGEYTNLIKQTKGFGMQVPKPQYTYRFGDIQNFEDFLTETQLQAGYDKSNMIYPENEERRNLFAEFILPWLILPAILIVAWIFIMRRMSGGGGAGGGW